MNEDWQQLRDALNHHWLRSEFPRHTEAFMVRLMAREPDLRRLGEFAEEDWVKWIVNRDDVFKLLDSAEDALSPRQLLDRPPLAGCDAETKGWLGALVHALWLVRTRIREKVRSARDALNDADALYRRLDPLLRGAGTSDVCRLRESSGEFRKFVSAVERLSESIHQLPQRIEVV